MTEAKVMEMLIGIKNEKEKQAGSHDTSTEDERLKENLLGKILRDHLPEITHSPIYSAEQKKAAQMIANCQTEEMGGYISYCSNCDTAVDYHYCSCNNRNCPNCQYPMQLKWVEMRKNEFIPGVKNYHIILTCPHDLNPIIMENPSLLLGLILRSSAHAVIEMCENPRVLGAKPAVLSVLHTWSSDLSPHYHAHMLVSGGGLDANGKFIRLQDVRREQKRKRKAAGNQENMEQEPPVSLQDDDEEGNDYFIHMPALTALYRGKFMAGLRELYKNRKLTIPGCMDELNDPVEWSRFCFKMEQKDWVGDIEKPPEHGENVIEYFSRYANRTAISNSRIISYDGKTVVFTSRVKSKDDPKKRVPVDTPMDVQTFIKRFLSHVLPKGFSRIRFFGIISNAQKAKNLQTIHDQTDGKAYSESPLKNLKGIDLLNALFPDKAFGICPHCKARLEAIPFGRAADRFDMNKRRKKAA